ncbi:MAG: hypothetical protein P8019_04425 [Gammaproteobacteria bacterium]|jgi:hypothetical protein
MLLTQKQFFKGDRVFEIVDDVVCVNIKSLFSKERLTVALSTLNPEPVVNDGELAFCDGLTSKPVFSLLLDKPNPEQFDAFVSALQRAILAQSVPLNSAQGESLPDTQPPAPGDNVYDEPPEFDDSGRQQKPGFQPVNAQRVGEDIVMLKTYLNEGDIQPLLKSLEMLQAEPQDEAIFQQVVDAYNASGFQQGAILTYAPYLKVLLSKYLTW